MKVVQATALKVNSDVVLMMKLLNKVKMMNVVKFLILDVAEMVKLPDLMLLDPIVDVPLLNLDVVMMESPPNNLIMMIVLMDVLLPYMDVVQMENTAKNQLKMTV